MGQLKITNQNGKQLIIDSGSILADKKLEPTDFKYIRDTMKDVGSVLEPQDGDVLCIKGYHEVGDDGQGIFVYKADEPRSNHNGGTVIDPTKEFPTNWNDTTQQNDWFNTTNEGNGCWVRQYSEYVFPEMFGAKGDGTTDDTKAIQKAINIATKGVYLLNKNYLVSKSTVLHSYYPNGDEPCIAIINKDNFSFLGKGKLKVNIHAQGILDINNSKNITVEGITFEGYGNFPPLDGTTGRGEKGTADAGYNTTDGESIWGKYRNNQLNTSNYTGVNGDPNAIWGTWGNGYIGNISAGITVLNQSENIIIKEVTCKNFNYTGIQLGLYTEAIPSKNIRITDCYLSDNYSSGINMRACKDVIIEKCYITNNGHPDSSVTDDVIDPGYGTSTTGSPNFIPTNIIIKDNFYYENKRKGIDFHSIIGTIVENNVVKNSAYGLAILDFTYEDRQCVIKSNHFETCGYTYGDALRYQQFINDSTHRNSDVIICDNMLINCSGYNGAIYFRKGNGVIIKGNYIRGNEVPNDKNASGSLVLIGKNDEATKNIIMSENKIETDKIFGIYCNWIENCIISDNIIKNSNSSGSVGIYQVSSSTKDILVTNNIVDGFNIATQSKNNIDENIKSGLNPFLSDGYFETLSFVIDGSDAYNPTYYGTNNLIASIENHSKGFQINFTEELAQKPIIFAPKFGTSPLTSGGANCSFPAIYELGTSYAVINLVKDSDSSSSITLNDLAGGYQLFTIIFRRKRQ
jgi:hypothetical protein